MDLRTLAHPLFAPQMPQFISDDAPSASDSATPSVSPLPSGTPVSPLVNTRPQRIRRPRDVWLPERWIIPQRYKRMREPTPAIPSSDEEDVLGQDFGKGAEVDCAGVIASGAPERGESGNPGKRVQALFFARPCGAQMSRVQKPSVDLLLVGLGVASHTVRQVLRSSEERRVLPSAIAQKCRCTCWKKRGVRARKKE
ncbi:hypothetical protein BJV74DRAFT_176176 [Russula compacta]|nr:hypothetical protein BJV74DRAFT_176176 [Russula compacta]